MKDYAVPLYNGEPILDETPRPAFRISAAEVVDSVKQQFTHTELALRELGQNSQDADATRITLDYRYEDGAMILDFLDDGFGMDLRTVRENYLRLFDSSKETQADKVGKWSLGRLSLLCYEPERIEVFTLSSGNPGYKVVIEKNLSGSLYEVDAGDMEALIGNPHGTLVRMTVMVGSQEEFARMAERSNQSVERELCWIKPVMTVKKVKLTEGVPEFLETPINREMIVPGRYSSSFTVRMASGEGQVRCSIGLESRDGKGLAPITLCTGGIPLERPSGLPWTGHNDFAFRGMQVILDSFSFRTNIGRNVVYRHTPFMSGFLPKFFEKIVLGKFVASMARLFAQPAFHSHEYEDAIRLLLSDVCIKSEEHGYTIPEEVCRVPFIPSYVSYRPYSLEQLDTGEGDIHVTSERPQMLSFRDLGEKQSDILCVCTADFPWDFRNFLEKRYKQRLRPKESSLIVDADNIELIDITRKLERLLAGERHWISGVFQGLAGSFQECSDIAVGYFRTYDGRTDTGTPTMFHKGSERVYLNYYHPHIRNLIGLILGEDDTYRDVAAHFLMREVLFSPDLKYTIPMREQLLANDIRSRFGEQAGIGLLFDQDDDVDGMRDLLEEMERLFRGNEIFKV